MPGYFFYGKSRDGSDAKLFEGMHLSPSGEFWGNFPISEAYEREMIFERDRPITRAERRANKRRK